MRAVVSAAVLALQATHAGAQIGPGPTRLGCVDLGCWGPPATICYRSAVAFSMGWGEGLAEPWLEKEGQSLPVRKIAIAHGHGQAAIRILAGPFRQPSSQWGVGPVRLILRQSEPPFRMGGDNSGVVSLAIEHLRENGEVEGVTQGACRAR